MKQTRKQIVLYAAWLCMYILCVGLGTVENVDGIGEILFLLTALIFFIPGIWLLYLGKKEKNIKTVRTVRILSVCSLALTVIVFCINVAAVSASGETGVFLNDLLNLVSAPMFCSRYWIVSLFCWACLLFGSFTKTKE